MRKNILYLSAFIITLFCFIGNLQASITNCTYLNSSQGLEVKFKIRDGLSERAQISGTINNEEDIRNWKKALKNSSFVGKDYFSKNNVCPPYIIITKSNTGLNLYVADSNSLNSVKQATLDYFSTMKKEYPKVLNLKGTDEQKAEQKEFENSIPSSCMTLTDKTPCETDRNFSCIWNETEYGNYCNTDKLRYVQCGDAFDIPYQAPGIISFFVNLLKIAAPIILIMVSIITLLKAISASNEDEIKKAQKGLIRKVIAAVMVFFVISIVQFVIMKVADSSETEDLSSCLSCFLNNDCEDNVYYKTNFGGTYLCKYLNGSKKTFECQGN